MTGRVKGWRAYVWIMTSVRWADQSERHICVHEIMYNETNLYLEFMYEMHAKKCFHFSQFSHRAFKKLPPLACNITQVTSARFGSHCQHCILSAGIYVSVIHVLDEHIIPQLSSVNSKSEKNKRRRKMRRQKGDGQKQTASLCGHKWNN